MRTKVGLGRPYLWIISIYYLKCNNSFEILFRFRFCSSDSRSHSRKSKEAICCGNKRKMRNGLNESTGKQDEQRERAKLKREIMLIQLVDDLTRNEKRIKLPTLEIVNIENYILWMKIPIRIQRGTRLTLVEFPWTRIIKKKYLLERIFEKEWTKKNTCRGCVTEMHIIWIRIK